MESKGRCEEEIPVYVSLNLIKGIFNELVDRLYGNGNGNGHKSKTVEPRPGREATPRFFLMRLNVITCDRRSVDSWEGEYEVAVEEKR